MGHEDDKPLQKKHVHLKEGQCGSYGRGIVEQAKEWTSKHLYRKRMVRGGGRGDGMEIEIGEQTEKRASNS